MAEQPSDSSRHPSGEIQEQQAQPPQQYAYGWPPPEDEISLFDIWDALVRRRWLIVGIGAAVTLLALAHALMQPDVYRYRQVLEIGTRVTERGVSLIESPNSVAAKLNQNYIPAAIQEWLSNHPESQWKPAVDASVPKDSEIVVLQAEVTPDRSENVATIMRSAAAAMQADHERIIQTIRQQMGVELTQERNELAGFNAEVERLQAQVARLDDRRTLLEQEIADLEHLLEDAETSRRQANRDVEGEAQAMTLLMLSNEVRETRRRLSELRESLRIDLANQRDELGSNIAEQKRAMEFKQSEIEALQTRLDNLSRTRALSEPQRSIRQVGTSGTLILALGIILGGMLGVFAAFIAEFAAAARRRHESTEVSAKA